MRACSRCATPLSAPVLSAAWCPSCEAPCGTSEVEAPAAPAGAALSSCSSCGRHPATHGAEGHAADRCGACGLGDAHGLE